MRLSSLAHAGLRHHRRSHLAVALGVAVATAVLTGALLVGDSVRGSLRDLTLKRLQRVDHALVTSQLFRAELAVELLNTEGFTDHFATADPAILLTVSASSRVDGEKRFASGVTLSGVTWGADSPAFWPSDFFRSDPPANEILQGIHLTPTLADELGVDVGDEVVLRLPSFETQPADSPLGDKAGGGVTARVTVSLITERAGFQLAPSQRRPRGACLDLQRLQSLLGANDQANAVLLSGWRRDRPAKPAGEAWLADALRPRLEDYGIAVESVGNGVTQIESRQLVLPDAVVQPAMEELDGAQPVVTYLANTLRLGNKTIPYSTVTGVDSTANGPLLRDDGEPIELADDEVVLNDWAADRLGAKPGDTITLTYYEPESTHGKLVEAPPLTLTLKAIVPIDGPAGDPRLTPVLEGVTDARSINDWDLPFELVEPISQADEDYWDDYSTTPKAFVSLSLAKRLWSTRWGSISLLRVPGSTAEEVGETLRNAIDPAELGFVFQPVKRLGLAASQGSTPFDGLFFGFSLFLIASSVLLIVLLFGLGVEQRAKEVGLLSAIGWSQAEVRRVLMREGLVVAGLGVAIGVPAGVLYAWLMIKGLTTVWVAAIVSPFLTLHVTTKSLAIGALLGLAFAWWAIRRTLRRVVARPPRALLAGQAHDAHGNIQHSRYARWTTVLLLALAVGLGIGVGNPATASSLSAEAQAGAFFAVGALLLAALLLATRGLMATRDDRAAPGRFGSWALALRNVARAPGRSLLTVAIVGCASFLILAISAFRLDPTEQGTGGFVLVGQSDQPIHFDLNTPEGRLELGLSEADEELLDRFNVHTLRVHDGEDASCLNLYQTRQPRVLGAPESNDLLSRFAYADRDSENGVTLPAVLDFNTAMYSLKLYGGVGSKLTIRDGVDRPVDVEVAGLLKNSILQGDLLLGEADFLELYPETGGSRFFLIEPTVDNADPVALAAMLEDRLSDYGFDAEDAVERLEGFLAVQNTYLSTFQSLGGLGLLLGVVGVAVVQLRNLTERRGEIALLRAAGFDAPSLRSLIFRENLLLLGGGLAVGALAAAVALAPQSLTNDTRLPWFDSGLLLAAIGGVGLVVGAMVTQSATRTPILPALRGD